MDNRWIDFLIEYFISFHKSKKMKKNIELSKNLNKTLEAFAKNHIKPAHDKICYTFLLIGLNRYKAIISLCELGLNNDAKILNRSFLEYFVKMYWIFDDKSKKKERLKQYKKLGDAYNYFLSSQIKEITTSKNEKSIKHLEYLKKIYEEYKHDEFEAPIEPKEMRISQICKEDFLIDEALQNLKKMYKKPYAFFSTFVHPNAYSHITYLETNKNNHSKPKFSPNLDNIEKNLYYAGHFLRLMFQLYARIYKINFKELDQKISQELNFN